MFVPPVCTSLQPATVDQQKTSNVQHTSTVYRTDIQPFIIQPIGDNNYEQDMVNENESRDLSPHPVEAQPDQQCIDTKETTSGISEGIAVLTQIGQIQLCHMDDTLGIKSPRLVAIRSEDHKSAFQCENKDPAVESKPIGSTFQPTDNRSHSDAQIRWAFEGGILKCVKIEDDLDFPVKSEPTGASTASVVKPKTKTKPRKQQSNWYRCDKCKRRCASERGLKIHAKSHEPREFYPCGTCGTVLSSSSALQKHSSRHVEESNTHDCNKCKETFKSSADLKKHLQIHLREKAFKCDVCERSFKLAETLAVHYETHAVDKPLECKECGKRFARLDGLALHESLHVKASNTTSVTAAEVDIQSEKMNACDRDSDDSAEPQEQVQSTSEDEDVSTEKEGKDGDDYLVDEEDEQHSSSSNEADDHENDSDDYCPPKASPKKKSWQKYSRPCLCDVCGKVFNCHSNLQSHITVHTGVKAYVCSTCGKAFRLPCSLKTHEVIHRSERPFACDVCEKAFKTRGHLRSHKSLHLDERRYPCPLCSKRFRSARQRSKHKRTHTGEKPFECDVCQQSFAASYTLKQHMRLHTGEKPYECQKCGRRFIQAACLKAHKQSHEVKQAKQANKGLVSGAKQVKSANKN